MYCNPALDNRNIKLDAFGGKYFKVVILAMQTAQAILREELVVFERTFKAAVKSQTPLLDRIMQFIVNRKGKQLRPMFVLLSAKLCGPVNDSAYRAASLVELLHTATLVHDDVVDESLERRGFFSTYALWKTRWKERRVGKEC